jgi:hypothetical protein
MPGLARRFSLLCGRIKRPDVTAIILVIAILATVDGLMGKSKVTGHGTNVDAEHQRATDRRPL